MRQTAGTLNRTWLAILGILALAAGTALLLQATGTLQTLAGTPPEGQKVITGNLPAFSAQPWTIAALLVLAVIIGVLATVWIIAQIPRKNTADTYRLHADGHQGRTTCGPSVIASAVEDQMNTLPGVVSSSALLRGTATEPDLTMKITVNDRADIRELLRRVETTTLPDLVRTLEVPLQRCRVQIDVSGRPQSTGTLVPSTGTVLQ